MCCMKCVWYSQSENTEYYCSCNTKSKLLHNESPVPRRYRCRRYIGELQMELQRNRGIIKRWPAPPRRVQAPLLQAAYRRWRAYLTLKPIPRDQWPQLKMKIYAASALRGRRGQWGQARQWLGDYLADNKYNAKAGECTLCVVRSVRPAHCSASGASKGRYGPLPRGQ